MNIKNLFLIALMMAATAVQGQLLNNVSVYGKISNTSPGTMAYLMELTGQKLNKLDSSAIREDGSFTLSANIQSANFFELTLGGKAYTILILHPNENVELVLNANDLMKPVSIKGSPDTKKVYEMLGQFNTYKGRQNELDKKYQQVYGTPQQDSVGKILLGEYQKIENDKNSWLKNTIYEDPSLASLLFLDQLKIDENLDLYEHVDKALYPKYSNLSFVGDLHRKVAAKLKLRVGHPAPEINLPTPEGNYVKLSSLRGHVVLVDFWASWCSPCRRESPNMVKFYDKYHDQGFEIYSVSLDKEKSSWVKAIKDDNLHWTHVSDLRFWGSVAAKDYGVGSIPFTVLIDKDGNVLATGLRGPSLEAKLQEIFGK